MDGVDVQEVPWEEVGRRLIVEVYRFESFITNLSTLVSGWWCGGATTGGPIWKTGSRNRGQFGIKRLCVENFRGTEALHHPAILEKNLWALLQKGLGLLQICQLNILRLRRLSWGA